MKKYFEEDYKKYKNIMMDYYPKTTMNFEQYEVENVIVTIFKIREVIKNVEEKHIKHIKKNIPELMYTLDNFLITLPIFRKKVVYLLLRNIVECVVNSWMLNIKGDKFSSFRDNKDFIKNTIIYNENKKMFDSLFNYFADFSSIIHFNESYHDNDFLSNRIALECSKEDWKKIKNSVAIFLKSLLILLREDENKMNTSYKILLQDVLSQNEYNLVVNKKVE